MNPSGGGYAATVHIRPRRARLRGRPSSLKGRYAIATRRAYGPPLTPEPLRPPSRAARPGKDQRPCPPEHAALNQDPYKSSLYGSRGLPGVRITG